MYIDRDTIIQAAATLFALGSVSFLVGMLLWLAWLKWKAQQHPRQMFPPEYDAVEDGELVLEQYQEQLERKKYEQNH